MLGSATCAEDVRARGAAPGGSAGFLVFLDLAMLSECCCDLVGEFSIIVAACPWVDDVLQLGNPKMGNGGFEPRAKMFNIRLLGYDKP